MHDALQAVRLDPDASLDEREAAKQAQHALSYGGSIPRDILSVLQGYVGRQLNQDRYGK